MTDTFGGFDTILADELGKLKRCSPAVTVRLTQCMTHGCLKVKYMHAYKGI